jgi:rod shape-determining protein MreD
VVILGGGGMDKKQTIFRCIIYTAEMVFFYVVSQMPNFLPSVVGHKPNLVLALLVSVILSEGSRISAGFGMACGFLFDIGLDVFVGLNAILLCVLCYFFGGLCNYYLRRTFVTCFMVSIVFISLFYHIQFVLLYLIPGYGDIYYAYIFHYVSAMFYSFIFAQVFYLLNAALCFKLRKNYLSF